MLQNEELEGRRKEDCRKLIEERKKRDRGKPLLLIL